MKRKWILFVAILAAVVLVSCNVNGEKASENSVESGTQDSSVAVAESSEAMLESMDELSTNESSIVSVETSAPVGKKGPSEKSCLASLLTILYRIRRRFLMIPNYMVTIRLSLVAIVTTM